MTARQRAVLTQRVIIEVWKGSDGYSKPTYLTPHTFACRITEEPRYTARLADPTVNADSMIWMDVADVNGATMASLITTAQGTSNPPPTMAVILGSSRITLPDGSRPPIRKFAAEYDPAGVHHFVIWC